jgi:putative MATE family efflux protein
MQIDMTKGRPPSVIFRFLVPVIFGNLLQQMYNAVDTMIVGRYAGSAALAAVGATGSLVFMINGFAQGLATGFTVSVSMRYGAKDQKGLTRCIGNAALLSVICAVILTAAGLLFARPLLILTNTPEEVLPMALSYLNIMVMGIATVLFYNFLACLLRAVGNSRVPLLFLLVSAAANIVLDLLLVGTYQMGPAGAALATVIAQLLSGILCLVYIGKKEAALHPGRDNFRLKRAETLNQLGMGVPMALQYSIIAIGTMMIQAALNLLGPAAMAAFAAANKIENLAEQSFSAMGQTIAVYCAQNRGTNDLERVQKGVRIGLAFTVVYALVIAGICLAAYPALTPLFVSGEAAEIAEIVEYVGVFFRCCAPLFIPLGMIFLYRNALQGCGNGVLPMLGGVVELGARAAAALIAMRSVTIAKVCNGNVWAWAAGGMFLWLAYLLYLRKLKKVRACQKAAAGV